jgi:subtilisin family serine protease
VFAIKTRNALILLIACISLAPANGAGKTSHAPDKPRTDGISVSAQEATRVRNAGSKAEYKEGEVLIQFKEGTSRYQAEHLAYAKQMSVSRHFKSLSRKKRGRYALIKGQTSTRKMLRKIENMPQVEAASPNYLRHMAATPDDPRYPELWGLARIDAARAWETETNASECIVASIDSGVDYTHQDLEGNMWSNPDESLNSADTDGNGYVDDIHGINAIADNGDPMDNNGHGTHTAGIMGAVGNNGKLLTGVGWDVRIMALKFLDVSGRGTIGNAIECMDYVLQQKEEGENIVAINASWSGLGHSDVMRAIIADLGELGIIVCAAAGNEGADIDEAPQYPASYDLDNVLAVAATNPDDDLAAFSNYGFASVDLGAPGTGIVSTLPGGGYSPRSGDIFYDDMESGDGSWIHYGNRDSWKITTEQKANAPSGNHTWSDSNGTDYKNDTNASLEADLSFDLSSRSGEKVAWGGWLEYALENPYDRIYLEVSGDGGTSWTPLWSFTGDSNGWGARAFHLPQSHKVDGARFRLRLVTDESVTQDGVYIDDAGLGTGAGSNATASYDGTSMATPHVTGAIALMAAEYPGEGMLARKHRILSGVDHVNDLEGKVFQEGRLNLAKAISTAPKACSHTLSLTELAFGAEGGHKNVSIAGRYSDCGWSASSAFAWISVQPRSGKGNGVVTVSVEENTLASARKGNASIAGNEIVVRQDPTTVSGTGGCIHNPKARFNVFSGFTLFIVFSLSLFIRQNKRR